MNKVKPSDLIYIKSIDSLGRNYHNVLHGLRFTSDNPNVYDATIRFFGNCNAIGCFTEDKYTIQSQLQRKLNDSRLNRKTFRVLNHSNWQGCADSLKQMSDTEFTKNDIIILISNFMEYGLKYYVNSKYISYTNIVSAFDRPHDMGEIFLDSSHMNHRGYKLFSDKVYSILSAPFSGTKHNAKDNIIIKHFPAKKARQVLTNNHLRLIFHFYKMKRKIAKASSAQSL